jgi:hypothetical protein
MIDADATCPERCPQLSNSVEISAYLSQPQPQQTQAIASDRTPS